LVCVVIMLTLSLVVIASLYVATAFGPLLWWPLVFFGIWLAAWVPLELLSAWYLRAYKVLEDCSRVGSEAGTPAKVTTYVSFVFVLFVVVVVVSVLVAFVRGLSSP